MQGNDALEFLGEVPAPGWLAFAIRHLLKIPGVRKMIGAWNHDPGEGLAVGRDAAHCDATKADAMVAALAADQTRALAFAARAMVGDRNLQGRIDGFRAGVREKDAVHAGRHHLRDARGGFKGERVRHLESRREIHLGHLAAHGLDDLGATMACIDAPQACRAVDHLAVIDGRVIHALGALEQSGCGLELLVGSEGHPEVGHIQSGGQADVFSDGIHGRFLRARNGNTQM